MDEIDDNQSIVPYLLSLTSDRHCHVHLGGAGHPKDASAPSPSTSLRDTAGDLLPGPFPWGRSCCLRGPEPHALLLHPPNSVGCSVNNCLQWLCIVIAVPLLEPVEDASQAVPHALEARHQKGVRQGGTVVLVLAVAFQECGVDVLLRLLMATRSRGGRRQRATPMRTGGKQKERNRRNHRGARANGTGKRQKGKERGMGRRGRPREEEGWRGLGSRLPAWTRAELPWPLRESPVPEVGLCLPPTLLA